MNVATSVQGLPSVPAIFTAIKRELGLVDPVWSSYPPQWRSLCALWLRVESALARTGHPDLSNDELTDLQVPEDIRQWMIDKRRSDKTQNPRSDFGKIWTKFLTGVALSASKGKRNILNEMWCRPGKTGIVMFLLGTYWQAEYSGSGKDWFANVERIDTIFNVILSHPDMYAFRSSFRTNVLTSTALENANGASGNLILFLQALRRSVG